MNTVDSETNDKNALLPSAAFTKSSTSEEGSDHGSDGGRRSVHPMLPPEYVDIQDEIDTCLTEIGTKSKLPPSSV